VGHHSEAFIGIDTAKLRNAVAIAEAGRRDEVRYLGSLDRSPCGLAVGRGKHDPRPPHHLRRRIEIRHQPPEPSPIFSRDRDVRSHAPSLQDLPAHGNPQSVTEQRQQ
jgi:hypothetical protein